MQELRREVESLLASDLPGHGAIRWAIREAAATAVEDRRQQEVWGGQSVSRHSAVQQPGDIGVFQCREDLPFVPEPCQDFRGIHAAANNLNRHLLFILFIGTYRSVHGSHAALADESRGPVSADAGLAICLVAG
jgi:hypothetical protein